MVWSVVTELYILRKGGHSLAKQLKARRLVKEESTPEELAALKNYRKFGAEFLTKSSNLVCFT